jgi:hypothetical protein
LLLTVQLFFLWGIRLLRGLCWFTLGVAGEYCVMLGAHVFGMSNVSQAGLELASGGSGSPPVFSV